MVFGLAIFGYHQLQTGGSREKEEKMKKFLIMLFTVFALIGCNSKLEVQKFNITKIEVFYIPFSITPPTQSDELSLREIPSFIISDSEMITAIKNEIQDLSKSGFNKKINRNSIFLACDFYEKDSLVFSLLYDKNIINIKNNDYAENETLIDLLVKNDQKWDNVPD